MFYQMDHIWWAPNRPKKSLGLKMKSQCTHTISFFNRDPVFLCCWLRETYQTKIRKVLKFWHQIIVTIVPVLFPTLYLWFEEIVPTRKLFSPARLSPCCSIMAIIISCSANDFLPINEKDELFQDHYKNHLFWDYTIFLGHQCFVLLSDTYQQVFLIWFPHFLIDFLPIFFLFAIITFALAEIDIICSKTSRWLMVSLTCKMLFTWK